MNGMKISPPTKKRIKAKVNGGISVSTYLKIGGAAPQMRYAIRIAIIPDIDLV